VIDSGADLNAYAKVENQSGCCSPVMEKPARAGLKILDSGTCCSPDASEVHSGLADLLRRYNVNDYAASVKVFAVKPAAEA